MQEREDEVIADEEREGCEFRGKEWSKIDLSLTCGAPCPGRSQEKWRRGGGGVGGCVPGSEVKIFKRLFTADLQNEVGKISREREARREAAEWEEHNG